MQIANIESFLLLFFGAMLDFSYKPKNPKPVISNKHKQLFLEDDFNGLLSAFEQVRPEIKWKKSPYYFLIICLIINVLIIYYFNKTYLSNKAKKLDINYSFNKLLYSFFLFIPCLGIFSIFDDNLFLYYFVIGFVVGVYSVIVGIYYLSSVTKK
jgi:hypothetical protein